MAQSKFGPKIRALRRRHGLRQVDLAGKLGISPSYLNLIEHDQRALTAPLLLKVAELFPADLQSFAPDDQARLISDLREVFGDALFEEHDVTTMDVGDTAANETVSRAILKLYHAYRDALESLQALAASASEGGDFLGLDPARLPSEEVADVLQQNQNYFAGIEQAAERLADEAGIDRPDVYSALVRCLERQGVAVVIEPHSGEKSVLRWYDPARRRLHISETLPPHARNFQIAHQIGLLSIADEFERVIAKSRLTTPDSVTLCRVAL